jgi:hypothetical protein
MWRIFFLICVAFGTAGCAIHPLPENMLGRQFRTSLIVHHIRCEARAAIKHAIVDYLRHVKLTELADQFSAPSFRLEQLDLYLRAMPNKVRANIIKYERAAITYDFTFDITEQNTVAAEVDFVNLLSNGAFSIGPKGQSDLQRQTVRLFRVNDTFGELIHINSDRCTEDGSPENFVYPVAGSIGLGEMIETFVDLNEFQNLTGSKDTDTVPTIADTFNFQTTISGSVGPQVTLTPLNHRFNVAGASLTASASRKDIHKVIVAMSLPALPNSNPAPAVTGFLGGSAPLARSPATAIDRNNNAIDNAINRSIINRLGSPNLPQ